MDFGQGSSPAEQLEGLELADGWKVVERIGSHPAGTGGSFSTPYVVENRDGERAFLKAIDFAAAVQAEDPARALETLTRVFNFERDLVHRCTTRRMPNVVKVLTDGTVTVPNGGPIPKVSYLIFELADGDIRRAMSLQESLDTAWALNTVKEAALGLNQLHAAGIAHQDVKPSNVLKFGDTEFKLGDLGRASVRGEDGLYDNLRVAGDPMYATPEQLFGFVLPDWDQRRRAADVFNLGSLLLFLLTKTNASASLVSHVPDAYLPPPYGSWSGSFDDVIVHLRQAVTAVVQAIPDFSDPELRPRIVRAFVELCEPDPRLRGHPKNRIGMGSQYSLERYVSEFSALSKRAERCVARAIRT